MRRLGRPVPTSTVILLLRLLWELGVQALHTLLPRLTTGRRSPEGRDEDFLAMRIYSRLAYLYWFYSGKVSCGWSHLRGLNLAERYPPSAELGQAYSEHAPVMTMIPWFSRALRYSRRSLEIRRDRRGRVGPGAEPELRRRDALRRLRLDEAEEACREAIRLLESTGDQWEVNTAGWNLAMCLHRKGELSEAAEVARSVYASAMAIGDQTSAGVALSVWTRATGGRVDPTLVATELARGSEDASTTTELRLAAALCSVYANDLSSAAAHLEEAASTIRHAGLRQEYVAPVACWNATVRRLQAESTPAHQPAERTRRLRRTARAVRGARFWAFSYRNNAPHALREAGLLAALRGHPRKATRLLTRSLETALSHGAVYEAALTEEALALLSPDERPLAEARARLRALEGQIDELPAQDLDIPTASLFDRFTTLLSVGRTITAAPSVPALESAIREAAIALLRGERCHLIDVTGSLDDRLTSTSGESVDAISRTLIARAIEEAQPVVASDPTADASESLLLSGIRSVLAAPIVVHGEVVTCFYVTHSQIGLLFGDEEVQLAAFVASLAGAAFEHLAGAETRFRSLGQNSSDVTTLLDRTGVVTYQSPAGSPLFTMPDPAVIGRPILDWVHPDDRMLFSAALDRAGRNADVRVECRFWLDAETIGHAETHGDRPAGRADRQRARPQHPRRHRPAPAGGPAARASAV